MKIEISHPDFTRWLGPERMSAIVARVAEDAEEEIKAWYRRLPEDWFDSAEASFPDGTPKHGRGRTFARRLSTGWSAEERHARGFALCFSAPREDGSAWGLRLQEYGGVVTPKKARVLTIPLTAEARGRRASEYSGSVHPLFAIGRERAEGDKAGTLVWRDEAGGLHAAYALRKRVTIEPLEKRRGHHAIPQKAELAEMLLPLFREAIRDVV